MADKINSKTKAIIAVDLAGRVANYEELYKIAYNSKNKFEPKNEIQRKMGRIAILADGAHSFGAEQNGKKVVILQILQVFHFMQLKI